MSSKATASAAFVYARHGSAAFNARMQTWLTSLTDDVRWVLGADLSALVLGGGYGRGEGGVLCGSGEERPYNDLDLVLIVRRKSSLPWRELGAIQHKYESLIGIQVDFSRPLTVNDIRRWRPSMMWTDLLHGHAVLYGPEDILTANAPDLKPEHLAPIEATRMLLNRGAGVLWALRILRDCEPAPDSDFVRRNYYKCALALGDALLIVHGRFQTSYAGRDERLSSLLEEARCSLSFDVAPLYRDALSFKFWPGQFPSQPDEQHVAALARRWGEILLYVENRRAGRDWQRLQDYAASREIREGEQNTLQQWPRNIDRKSV